MHTPEDELASEYVIDSFLGSLSNPMVSDITVGVWVKIIGSDTSRRIFDFYDVWRVSYVERQIVLTILQPVSRRQFKCTIQALLNQWNHVVISFKRINFKGDKKHMEIRIHINGKVCFSSSNWLTNLGKLSELLYILPTFTSTPFSFADALTMYKGCKTVVFVAQWFERERKNYMQVGLAN